MVCCFRVSFLLHGLPLRRGCGVCTNGCVGLSTRWWPLRPKHVVHVNVWYTRIYTRDWVDWAIKSIVLHTIWRCNMILWLKTDFLSEDSPTPTNCIPQLFSNSAAGYNWLGLSSGLTRQAYSVHVTLSIYEGKIALIKIKLVFPQRPPLHIAFSPTSITTLLPSSLSNISDRLCIMVKEHVTAQPSADGAKCSISLTISTRALSPNHWMQSR
jgi:hypothetical protein